MVTVNGEKRDCAGQTVPQLLDEMGYNRLHIAVEINEVIISRDDYDNTVINNGDVVEIVTFMGGGQQGAASHFRI